MSSQKHIIYRQVLEVDVPSVEGAWQIQNRVSDHFKYNLLQVMSDIFDSISAPGEVLRIDKLELDLGDLKEQDLEGEITEKVKEKLTERLLQLKQKAAGNSGENLPETVSLQKRPVNYSPSDFLFHFLRTGTAPWWHDREQFGSASFVFEDMMKHAPQWTKSSFQKFLREKIVRKRMIGTFDDQLIQKFVSLYDLTLAKELARFFKLISENKIGIQQKNNAEEKEIRVQLSGKTKSDMQPMEMVRAEFLDAVLIAVQSANKEALENYFSKYQIVFPGEQSSSGLLVELERFASGINIELNALAVETEMLNTTDTPQRKKKKRVRMKRTKENLKRDSDYIEDEVEETESEISEENWISEDGAELDENDTAVIESKENKPEMKSPEKKNRKRKKTDSIESETDSENDSAVENPAAEIQNIEKRKTAELISEIEKQKKTEESFPLPEPEDLSDFVIDNAGLVLAWPYLGAFFRELGLVSDRKFATEAAASRAVHLLQYLSDNGEFEYEEHDLVLNKILCGIDITEPIDMHFEITETEKEEVDGLLTGIRTNWNALGSTSNNGLRISFLRKEGSLKKTDQGWNLSIERTTIDMLLDRLPWSISIIRLPWSKDLLYVEW